MIAEVARRIRENIQKVIIGKDDVIDLSMVAVLCEGHVLMEDVPGIGKTTLARALAASLGCSFRRIQFTPDLLPSDVTGLNWFNQKEQAFEYRPGPVMAQVVLADEINRATPRTQSALLEAMQEQQVTVDGVTRPLPRPFLVLATQNPIEYEGTFPLPEAQLDRFLLRLSLGYPDHTVERQILYNLRREHPITQLAAIESGADGRTPIQALLDHQKRIWDVHVDESLQDYIIELVSATRSHPDLALGGSPRASLALFKASQALAAIRGRDHVIPDDIKQLAVPTLAHRLIAKPEAELRGRTPLSILQDLLSSTPLPVGVPD